mgnify:CR=1 FL=1
MTASRIRNFSIIAHIDHGKSTLADRILDVCGALGHGEARAQVLDTMALERERGITIKAQTVALDYRSLSGETYRFNLIDTPGHVDFSYEVSRALAACEGAILVVDATQGVQAQTLENCYKAIDEGVEIIPALNKIDLPAAEPERVAQEIEEVIGLGRAPSLVSAKTGEGVRELLERVIQEVPPPRGDSEGALAALVIDSWFDNYLGVVVLVRVFSGTLKPGDEILLMASSQSYICETLGHFRPKSAQVESLAAGEVGFVVAGIKTIAHARVGDTLTHKKNPVSSPLPGFKEIKPQVFAGLYPSETVDFEKLREALEKLHLNDASLTFEPESSQALGFGFRCGFLGLLHMDIIRERLEREYGLDLVVTAPTVAYQVRQKDDKVFLVDSPAKLPDPSKIACLSEPMIRARILTPQEYLGAVLQLASDRRGEQKNMEHLGKLVVLDYELPLAEVVYDFFDRLKSLSRGYASFDYEFSAFVPANLVCLDILINGDKVDALSFIVHAQAAPARGRAVVEKLAQVVPRQMFDVAIQAAVGGKILARETVKALRKNVLAKCYGGDITRKKKLLEKQKEGKKRLKQLGKVEIPQEAFLAVLHAGK